MVSCLVILISVNLKTHILGGRLENGRVFYSFCGTKYWYYLSNLFRTLTVERKHDGWAALTVRCDADHNGQWKCEADIGMTLLAKGGGESNLCSKVRT